MMKIVGVTILAILALLPIARANQHASHGGQEQRDVQALPPEEIQAYLAGKGLGLAKAAELNHYPGPAHVLELADKLALTSEQREATEKIFSSMETEAKRVGKEFIERERELDRLFADGSIDDEILSSTLGQIGRLQAAIRGIHLRAHLQQKVLLTEGQIAKYDELRGYTDGGKPSQGGHHRP